MTFPEAGHYPAVSHIMVDAERGAHGIVKVTRSWGGYLLVKARPVLPTGFTFRGLASVVLVTVLAGVHSGASSTEPCSYLTGISYPNNCRDDRYR